MWQQMLNHPIPFFKNFFYRPSPHINLLILNRQIISEKLKNFQKQVIYKIFIKYFAPKSPPMFEIFRSTLVDPRFGCHQRFQV